MAERNMDMKKCPMPVQDPDVRNKNFDEVALGYTYDMAVNEARRCLNCPKKPCQSACPVQIDIPAFIERVANEDMDGAFEILSKSTSLPAVCGRVCPQENQCEGKCVRGIKGEAVGIGRLERFVADYHREHCTDTPEMPEQNGHKVAVIGAGPSGLTVAGDVIIGADSHTCTYGALGAFSTGVGSTDMAAGMATGKAWFKVPGAIKFNLVGKPNKYISGKDVILHIIGMIGVDGALYKSMEFVGEGIKNLSMDDRFTIANMAIEAGGKNGIFPVDEKAIAYMEEHSTKKYTVYEADEDAVYDEEYTIDLSTLKSTVAFPHLPENTHTIDEIDPALKIDQVVIGSCTNGRIDDLRCAAEILKGRKVAKGMRLIVIPATQAIYLQAMEEGLLKIFIEAGGVVSTPTCGPCLGGYMGILAENERCVSTTNRNFVGRMGHVTSEIYLASPAVAAASAITGHISDPAKL